MSKLKEEVKKRLLKVDREGMKDLVNYMDENGYFECPASTKYHGAHEEGLIEHGESVYNLLSKFNNEFKLGLTEDTMVICSYLHDLCKVGAYVRTYEGYQWNQQHPKGHAVLSVKRIKEYIDITNTEEIIILHHMSFYGTYEFSDYGGEYSLNILGNIFGRHKVAKLFAFCDDMSTNFMEDQK